MRVAIVTKQEGAYGTVESQICLYKCMVNIACTLNMNLYT